MQGNERQAKHAAQQLGHNVEDDHPWGMSQVLRWTCTKCGNAVLLNGMMIYGSAIEQSCND